MTMRLVPKRLRRCVSLEAWGAFIGRFLNGISSAHGCVHLVHALDSYGRGLGEYDQRDGDASRDGAAGDRLFRYQHF